MSFFASHCKLALLLILNKCIFSMLSVTRGTVSCYCRRHSPSQNAKSNKFMRHAEAEKIIECLKKLLKFWPVSLARERDREIDILHTLMLLATAFDFRLISTSTKHFYLSSLFRVFFAFSFWQSSNIHGKLKMSWVVLAPRFAHDLCCYDKQYIFLSHSNRASAIHNSQQK